MSDTALDLLSSPSDLEAQALMAMSQRPSTAWTPPSSAVLKLQIGEGCTRRVRIEQLLNKDGTLSFKRLLHWAVRYTPAFGDKYDSFVDWEVNWAEFSKKWEVKIIYKMQGSWLRIDSDRDLVAAFERAARAPPAPIIPKWASPPAAISAKEDVIVVPCKVVVKDYRKSTLKRSSSSGSLNSKKVKKGTASRQRRAKRVMRWSSPPRGSINYHKQMRDLVRQLVALFTTAAIVLNAKLEDATREEARQMYRNKAKQLLRELCEAMDEARGMAGAADSSEEEQSDEEVPDVSKPEAKQVDPDFVHGRHGCDGCGMQPIVGLRYHSTTVEDFDLCQVCMGKNVGAQNTFVVEQLACDEPFQDKKIDFDACEFGESEGKAEGKAVVDAATTTTTTASTIEDMDVVERTLTVQPAAATAVVVEDVTDDEDEEEEADASSMVIACDKAVQSDEESFETNEEEPAVAAKEEVKPAPSASKKNKTSMEAIAQFEKAVFMMGSAFDKVIEGGSNVAEKSKESVAALTTATAMMLAATVETDQTKPAPKAKMQRVAESKQHAQLFAKAALSHRMTAPRTTGKPLNLLSKVGSTFALITQPVVQALKEQVEAVEAVKKGSPRTRKVNANDSYNKGHISDKDFEQFLQWWSPSEKAATSAKASKNAVSHENDGHLNDESFDHFMNTWSTSSRPAKKAIVQDFRNSTNNNDGQLSDADFEKFMSNWPVAPTTPLATKKRSRRSEVNASNGEISDEDFENFLSSWNTTPAKKAKAPSSAAAHAVVADGTISDDDFRQFLSWWSTSGPSAHARGTSNHSSSERSISVDSSVSVMSVDISAESSTKASDTAASGSEDEGVEIQLEDGMIVLGAHSEDDDMWNFVENSDMDLGNAAAMLGSSMYEQDLAASAEAGSSASNNTIIISNASDETVVISCPGDDSAFSSSSLASSISLISAEDSADDFSIVGGDDDVDVDDVSSSASIISFESEM